MTRTRKASNCPSLDPKISGRAAQATTHGAVASLPTSTKESQNGAKHAISSGPNLSAQRHDSKYVQEEAKSSLRQMPGLALVVAAVGLSGVFPVPAFVDLPGVGPVPAASSIGALFPALSCSWFGSGTLNMS